jgi:hypothetical protein
LGHLKGLHLELVVLELGLFRRDASMKVHHILRVGRGIERA